MQPKVYTIAAHRPFLATLAAGLLGMAGADPLQLPRITVLLPTRRAVRSLRDAFLRVAPDGKVAGTPLLLPRMRPIGDLASDELSLSDGGAEDMAVPPPIPELRRRLLLTRLVLHWGERRGEEPLLPGQAAALAASLARLLDRVATEGASFAKIADLVPEGLAEHWRVVHQFLEILPQHWPRILAEEEALDAASRRNLLLEQQTAAWRRSPPRHPVIAAGLIGGIPAMTELLSLVAALQEGAVILPGLDRDRDAAEWSAIEEDEAHPQHLMAGLLRALDLTPAEIRDWPTSRPDPIPARGFEGLSDLPLFASLSRGAGESAERSSEGAIARRVRLIAEALRPAITTDAWRRLPAQPADTLDGLSRYECASPQAEAVTIALLLRRKLKTPGATAALVTPDRELARRVAAELRRWGIDIDNSAGLPLNRTPPGVFLRLVLDLAASQLAPVPLLAALKHPLASGGLAPVAFRDLARQLEQAIRGPRPAPGFSGLRAALAGERAGLARFLDRLEACLGPLPELLVADAVPLSRVAAAHVEAAERLAATATETGGERLWHEAAGEAAARFCHELIDAARDFPRLPGRHYPALFEALAADAVVRPVYGRHPRLAIWGLLEARLQQADLIVLGGLNEGSWPPSAEHDPWMSRQMRREFGIALPERAIGLAAHDFAQALGAPEVALTRAARSEGVPTVPSRWLLRLDAVLQAVGLDGALGPDDTLRHAAELIDRAEGYWPLPPPEPRPPLAARPRKLSVTQIETWLRDPYAIYARHILGLRGAGRTRRRSRPRRTWHRHPSDARRLLTAGSRGECRMMPRRSCCASAASNSDPSCRAPARGRSGGLASRGSPAGWSIRSASDASASSRGSANARGAGQCRGAGGPFTITAKADRIDRLADGGFLLVDYKTGAVPSGKAGANGVCAATAS